MPEIVGVFAPQFFLVVGIDFFLAAGIATILLDRHFPNAFPYMMVIGGFFGFSQLVAGPAYMSTFSDVLQFYYCAGFALIALASLIALNLYLFLMKKMLIESGILSVTVTIPASFILLYFVDAYVNNISVPLPNFPVLPLSGIFIAFFGSIIILSAMIIITYLGNKRKPESRNQGPDEQAVVQEPPTKEETAECPLCRMPVSLSLSVCPYCGAEFEGDKVEDVVESEKKEAPKVEPPRVEPPSRTEASDPWERILQITSKSQRKSGMSKASNKR